MADQDTHFQASGKIGRVPGFTVTSRVALCLALATGEGLVAGFVVFCVAIAYHALGLGLPTSRLPINLYVEFGGAVGLIYAGFSLVSVARLLDQATTQVAALTDAAIGWTGALSGALLLAFVVGLAGDLSRASFLVAFVVGFPVALMARNLVFRRITARIRAGDLRIHRVAVVGAQVDVLRFLLNGHVARSGYQLADTFYTEEDGGAAAVIDQAAMVAAARRWVADGIENVIVVGDIGEVDALERFTDALKRYALNVMCAPATSNTTLKFLDVVPVGANNALRVLRKPMGDSAVLVKRVFDVCGAAFGLLLLSPLLGLVALAIRLDTPGPVFYRQERRGFNGEVFRIWKFRSMTVTESGHDMRQAERGDARVTQVGRVIRPLSIDELPQLINVLMGEMSLVGPRPHAVAHDDELGQQLASYAHRQRIKPGITGWAQVNGFRGETRTFAQVEGRTLHDLYYIDNWSLLLDCWIIILTVFSSRTRHNAF